jgi:hypothetical protein
LIQGKGAEKEDEGLIEGTVTAKVSSSILPKSKERIQPCLLSCNKIIPKFEPGH